MAKSRKSYVFTKESISTIIAVDCSNVSFMMKKFRDWAVHSFAVIVLCAGDFNDFLSLRYVIDSQRNTNQFFKVSNVTPKSASNKLLYYNYYTIYLFGFTIGL